jgi:hypothetical protein
MERIGVTSSDVASVGYDRAAGVLEVEFLTGSIYQYQGVPASVYEGLMSAPSHGKYFAAYIKKGPYSYAQIR